MFSPKEVNEQHRNSDVDSGVFAQHHTLGKQQNQAAAGNHEHDAIPVGVFLPYLGVIDPSPVVVILDGRAISRTTYPVLWGMFGTTYGAGDGSTTFNIPNLRGRTLVGYDSSQVEFNVVGMAGGTKTVTLTGYQSGVQAHHHEIRGASGGAPNDTNDRFLRASYGDDANFRSGMVTDASYNYGAQTYPAGKSAVESHNNLQPYIVVNYIIRLG